ncbi:multidrug efflux SMR transporter [Sphingomonas aliaeris]|uniref:Multidrug efflux SMR transporter n=1 Tax=Sphingomonas aliaeris TaxID=2759526 RepID=A0A974NSB9_9SPHN|nr:multidrug efflux SMR transporter [Sphingomonas aliaeris]QQV76005.1 multidrug efflux SMR transporter [Sphingomonas aliaeris]
MPNWAWLAIAIVSEVVATSFLKATEGFSRPVPSIIVAIGYAAAFYFLSFALRSIPVGVAYAIWSGAGVVMVTGVAWIAYGQKLDAVALGAIGLIVAGVVILNLRPGHG